MNKVYTITFGDVAENHARMQKIGVLADHGYSVEKIIALKEKLEGDGLECEILHLDDYLKGSDVYGDVEFDDIEEACVLVIRKGVQSILGGVDTKELMAEHDTLTVDKHAFMKGRVVNKHARWNLCFSDEDQEPLYEDGKGRIVAYHHIPLTQKVREKVSEWMEDGLLNGEANYYYDISKCGIGFHGDAERRKVVAMRMGESMPLYYQWYHRSNPVGDRIKIDLHDGDMYVMSEKAVGTDWMKKITPTLRHATGCDKFVNVK